MCTDLCSRIWSPFGICLAVVYLGRVGDGLFRSPQWLRWFTALLAVGAPFSSHWIKSLCTVWSLRGQKQFHLWIWGKPGRHSELQASWGYIMRPCLHKKTERKKEKKKFRTTKLTDTYRIEKKCQLCFRQEFTLDYTGESKIVWWTLRASGTEEEVRGGTSKGPKGHYWLEDWGPLEIRKEK